MPKKSQKSKLPTPWDVMLPYAGQRLAVGGMEIARNVRQRIWMENPDGEGMELSAKEEIQLAAMLRRWFNKRF